MPSTHESFWTHDRYAFVGHTKKKNFPKLSYGAARDLGKKVYAVDPSVDTILGDTCYPDLASLPESVDGVVLEVPKEETKDWVEKAAEAGIKDVWIHMQRETPEALALAKEKGLNVLTGTCAVMYLKRGFTYHSIHKWIMKLGKKY